MSEKTWRIGVAGLGTVGAGLLTFLADRPDFAPAGGRAVVTGVSARSRSRPRPFDISNLPWFDDPVALATSLVDRVVQVSEEEISEGVLQTLERAKLLAEPAG